MVIEAQPEIKLKANAAKANAALFILVFPFLFRQDRRVVEPSKGVMGLSSLYAGSFVLFWPCGPLRSHPAWGSDVPFCSMLDRDLFGLLSHSIFELDALNDLVDIINLQIVRNGHRFGLEIGLF